MNDFLIMTHKASRQFREILDWLLAEEPQLRSIMLGCLKVAFVIKEKDTPMGKVTDYAVTMKNGKNIVVTTRKSYDRRSPDGTQMCVFVINIKES